MIKEINKDIIFLKIKSVDATIADLDIVKDLEDTLLFNKKICVGLAANMIGVSKNIISFFDKENIVTMINPIITLKDKEYQTEEGCLSLDGVRKCIRYNVITVTYFDKNFNKKIKTYRGFTAEIIQHEIDHLNGIII
ncbi:MAG: peptide deformylase [Acholeplasmatales bacterium]|nr:peptide deformylase [Acholeplasmatales bacterium]